VKLHRTIVKQYKKDFYAERASYMIAQILQNQGKYEEAAKAFTTYLASYPKGSSRDDAEYSLALALLSAKDPAKAKNVLAKLASRAKKTEWGFYRQLE